MHTLCFYCRMFDCSYDTLLSYKYVKAKNDYMNIGVLNSYTNELMKWSKVEVKKVITLKKKLQNLMLVYINICIYIPERLHDALTIWYDYHCAPIRHSQQWCVIQWWLLPFSNHCCFQNPHEL